MTEIIIKEKFNIVGKPIIHPDAKAKVTGQAKFADDYKLPNMLFGVIVRTKVSHALIKGIDYSAIIKDLNIVTIVDASDIKGEKVTGLVRKDQPVFVFQKIVTPGKAVAMLVEDSETVLRKLTKKLKLILKSYLF